MDGDSDARGQNRSPAVSNHDKVFGRLAVASGLVDEATVATASQQVSSGKNLAAVLVESGAISDETCRFIEQQIDGFGDDAEQDLTGAASATISFVHLGELKTGSFNPVAKRDYRTTSDFGDYEIIEPIAEGGMGVVYKARQTKLNRLVALKMIRSGEFADDEEVQRFDSEARAAAKLDHPGIVPVYEVGEINGQHFYSMALVEGVSLHEKVKRDGPMSPQRAAETLKQVAEAVQFAHDAGIINRDVKPHNILLDQSDSPRVVDFGLAKQGDSDLTIAGQVLGTPSYMSPEQAEGNQGEIGPASDVYSLGATLYYVLTGHPPFRAESVVKTLKKVVEDRPDSIRQWNHAVDQNLQSICLKCMEKAPARRYSTAQDLAQDLGRWLQKKPVQARPVTRAAQVLIWCRRNRLVAALLLISGFLTVAVISTYFWFYGSPPTGAAMGVFLFPDDEMESGFQAGEIRRRGAWVKTVIWEGSARKAGIRRLDLIVAIDGSKVESKADLVRKLANKSVGSTVDVTVIRNEEEIRFERIELVSRRRLPSLVPWGGGATKPDNVSEPPVRAPVPLP